MAQFSHLNELTGPKYFRLNQLEMETEFASKEEIEQNKRFRLIKLRNEGVPEFKHLTSIPTDDKNIPDDFFEVITFNCLLNLFVLYVLFFLLSEGCI